MGQPEKGDTRIHEEVDGLRAEVAALHREHDEYRKAEDALRYRIAFERLIMGISTKFINLPPGRINAGIDDALRALGEFVGADRSYVFLYSDDGARMSNTHEWCTEGTASAQRRLQDVPREAFPWFDAQISRCGTVHVPRVHDLPPEADREKTEWAAESIKSLICVPMLCREGQVGFLGFDSVHADKSWPDDVAALLRVSGEILANALQRKRTEEQLTLLSSAVEQGSEGVALIDLNERVIYANRAFAEMHGYQPDDVLQQHVSIFHTPDQMPEVDRAIRQILETGEFSGELWHARRDGRVFLTYMRNSLVRDPSGRPIAMTGTARNITEQKRAEEALRESQRTLITLMSNLQGMAYRCRNDPSWTMEFVSEGCLELTGYRPADLIQNQRVSYADLIRSDDRRMVWDGVQDAVSRKVPFRINYRIVTATDEEKWVWEQGRGVYSPDGELLALEGFIADITERKQAEEALRSAHDRLEECVAARTANLTIANQQLLEEIAERECAQEELRAQGEVLGNILSNIPHHVFWKDRNSIYLGCNESFARVAGVSRPEDIVGKSDYDLAWRKEEADFFRQCDQDVMASGIPMLNIEEPQLQADGREAFLLTDKVPLRDRNGTVVGILGIYADITDLKRAEDALRESEQRLQGIFNNTSVVISEKDQSGRYLFANRRFEEIFHITQAYVVGKTDHEIFPARIADTFSSNDQRVLQDCAPVEFEEIVPQEDGNHTYLSLKFPLFDPGGVPYAVCSLSTDITERQRAADALKQAKEEAEAAVRTKSRFLANISHEIRTPVTAMLGAAELLPGSSPDEYHHRTEIILRNGQHLLSLIDDLLDLSRVEAGRFDVEAVRCSLPDLLADVRAVTAPLHQSREVDFRFVCETAIPSCIRTDPTRLKQAIINLINNALKFTEAGNVSVRVRVDRESPEPTLSIHVEDTGIGIATEDLEKIFQPFTQLDTSPAKAWAGVGLGLPLVRWIADRLGGHLDVTSEPRRGSTFALTVPTGPLDDAEWVSPVEATTPIQPGAPPPVALTGLSGRVLLAEDSRDARELVAFALREAGADVVTVADGVEAVRSVEEHAFDLVLMDVRMPRMDGFAATAELRRKGFLSPIIALTASSDRSDHERMRVAGFDDYWQKPIPLRRLVEMAALYLHEQEVRENQPSPTPAASPRAADVDVRLSALRAEFESSLPARLLALQEALRQGDDEALHHTLHQLAGTAGIYGHMPLSQEAARLKEMADRGALEKQRNVLHHLETLIAGVVNPAHDLSK